MKALKIGLLFVAMCCMLASACGEPSDNDKKIGGPEVLAQVVHVPGSGWNAQHEGWQLTFQSGLCIFVNRYLGERHQEMYKGGLYVGKTYNIYETSKEKPYVKLAE